MALTKYQKGRIAEDEWRDSISEQNRDNQIKIEKEPKNFIEAFILIETEILGKQNSDLHTESKGFFVKSVHYNESNLKKIKSLLIQAEQFIPSYDEKKISNLYTLFDGLKKKIESNKNVFEIKKNVSQIRQLLNQ